MKNGETGAGNPAGTGVTEVVVDVRLEGTTLVVVRQQLRATEGRLELVGPRRETRKNASAVA
jgi:hypothetical protein